MVIGMSGSLRRDPNDKRQLMLQTWYPSIETNSEKLPFLDHLKIRAKTIAQAGKFPSFWQCILKKSNKQCFKFARCIRGGTISNRHHISWYYRYAPTSYVPRRKIGKRRLRCFCDGSHLRCKYYRVSRWVHS